MHSRDLEKDCACVSVDVSVSLFTFTPVSGPLLVGFLSLSSDTLSGSLCSGILCESHSDIVVI